MSDRTETKPIQFSLWAMVLCVCASSALLALVRGVFWPMVLAGSFGFFALDRWFAGDVRRLRSPGAFLLVGLGSLLLAGTVVGSLLAWPSVLAVGIGAAAIDRAIRRGGAKLKTPGTIFLLALGAVLVLIAVGFTMGMLTALDNAVPR